MRANKSGRIAEGVIEALLLQHRCEFTKQATVGASIYGTAIHADFVIQNFPDFPRGLVLEVKWQDRGGSVDEKFPYLVTNAKSGGYGRPVILIAFGPGLRPGALTWVRGQIDPAHLIAVLTLEELMSWLQRRVPLQQPVA